jgi:hypothetical protein
LGGGVHQENVGLVRLNIKNGHFSQYAHEGKGLTVGNKDKSFCRSIFSRILRAHLMNITKFVTDLNLFGKKPVSNIRLKRSVK